MGERGWPSVKVTVLIATYDGAGRIGPCLDSLAAQTLSGRDFEILVVQNGPPCETPALVRRFAESHPDLCIRLLELTEPGAGHARNVGVHAARGRYLTYLDDDDQLTPGALAAMLDGLDGPDEVDGQIVPIMLVGEHAEPTGTVSHDNYVSRNLAPYIGRVLPVERMHVALGFNAGRLLPTSVARQVTYDESLRSGEDLVHWMEVLARFPFRFRVVDPAADAVYLRLVRPGSRGRQGQDYDFLVTQRLECIAALQRVAITDRAAKVVRDHLVVAQADWINRFLASHPGHHADVVQDVGRRQLRDIPWPRINRGLGANLVLQYSASPDVDSTAFAGAVGVAGRATPVDLIHNGPGSFETLDRGWLETCAPYVCRRRVRTDSNDPGTWAAAGQYVEHVLETVMTWEARSGGHEEVWTRSSALAGHLAAARLRLDRPELRWVVELPQRLHLPTGAASDHRGSEHTLELLRERLGEWGPSGPQGPFPEWLAVADRVLVADDDHRDRFLEGFADDALRDHLAARVEITPSIGDAHHLLCVASTGCDDGVEDLLDVIDRLPWERRCRTTVHLASPRWHRLGVDVAARGLDDVVTVTPMRPLAQIAATMPVLAAPVGVGDAAAALRRTSASGSGVR